MLEAEMKKPEARKFTISQDLKFLDELPRRARDDSHLKEENKRGEHQRTTSSPSQLEGCSHQLLAQLLKGSSERCADSRLLLNSPSLWKDTRTHVVVELYETERSYVESLQTLVMKYLQPLKKSENNYLIDAGIVDEIFYQIPEILMHHEIFLEELRRRLEAWDINQKVGDLFLETFTKQSVIDTYTAFINNWKNAKDAIKASTQSKPAFARFLENMAREHKGKLALDSLLIMPVQRIPRYELLIQTLLKHTEECHSDAQTLLEAQQAIHDLAVTINLGQRGAVRGLSQELCQLESLIEGLAGLASPERTFLSHDQVSITTSQGRKDRALFLFSDLLIITSIKRRSGTIKKPNQNAPSSVISSLEGNKYKLLMKIPLDELEIVKDENVRKLLKEMEQLSADVGTLSQMSELCANLHCPHSQLEESVRDMLAALNRQLCERHSADSQLSHLDLNITTPNGVENIGLIFSKPEKRTNWEEVFTEAKNRLAACGDRRGCPELVAAVPVRKTRAGLTFTCAGPTPASAEVWVCNSDGYVGQVCVLSLARPSEPTVTSCNGVCNARILCIAPVPGSVSSQQSNNDNNACTNCNSGVISISVEDTDKSAASIHLDSSSSSDDDDLKEDNKTDSNEDLVSGTMWLGTEDGCILIYNSTDNIRTKKNKVKIQHTSPVHTIIHLDKKVYVALANGDVMVYQRDLNGSWKTSDGITINVSTPSAPVTKMVPISGRLWCACHTSLKILNTNSFAIEHSLAVSGEGNRSIACLVGAGLGAWLSLHNSATVRLYHSSSFECLAEVSVAPAVSKMLASCDDIIRQHKAACLRVTALLASKELLWVGTSAGVILTLPLPHLSAATAKLAASPQVTGVPHGHTGHVRFLTTVDLEVRRGKTSDKPLIISGGDGYEDFRSASVSELAGREDSTNHILLWQV
ncbi:rho guanine nucleotide exchange factor 17 isoform X2 [Halyomorpha halys]|uniref:rho guanine nucleotide exchange factor 17 isoform X2 n=1 Tax=Halyomorpha halys TaxID=286706 RepID=UPI000D0C87BE|nr:rho guanine nucleotide exchange factor 17 isoform X1 [Halyomorpha halys]